MKVAIVGKGRVGDALGPTITNAGHEVVFAVREPTAEKYANSPIPVLGTAEAVAWADIIVAAILWADVDGFLAAAGNMAGKILIDCINPYDFGGGLNRLIDGNTSTAALIQAKSNAIVVKTLNQVGSPVMADPNRYLGRPLQFVASDNEPAKAVVSQLLGDVGFEVRNAGGLDHAVDLEAMARLWIAQTFTKGMRTDTAWMLVGAS